MSFIKIQFGALTKTLDMLVIVEHLVQKQLGYKKRSLDLFTVSVNNYSMGDDQEQELHPQETPQEAYERLLKPNIDASAGVETEIPPAPRSVNEDVTPDLLHLGHDDI